MYSFSYYNCISSFLSHVQVAAVFLFDFPVVKGASAHSVGVNIISERRFDVQQPPSDGKEL